MVDVREQREDAEEQISKTPEAAILLIGNELLSGKIRDENAYWLCGELRALGVRVRHIAVVPDEEAAIVEALRRLAGSVDHLFTSGGVGPTHDDITLESVAAAFEVPLYEDLALASQLKSFFQERLTEAHLRMARIPEGSTLIQIPESPWPVYSFRNIYIFPGVPHILQRKFSAIAERFRASSFSLARLYLDADEGSIAALLEEVERRHAVEIGSYPRTRSDELHRILITVEAKSSSRVESAVGDLIASLPSGALLSRELPPGERSLQ